MITFIESGNRIATENFEIGEIYTITFTNGNYKTMCCVGVGSDFVMFQDKLPNALFCLTLGTAETVLTIDLGGGGSGAMNYNELENKPQINGIVLIGNKTASDLNLVLQSDLDNYVTETELTNELGDYATTASVTAALASKQNQLTTTQLTAINSGITSALVNQITTNKNNILLLDTKNAQNSGNILLVEQANGKKNLFNLESWKNVPCTRSTLTVSGTEITLTNTGTDGYTNYTTADGYPQDCIIPVSADDKIVATWDIVGTPPSGSVELLGNGLTSTGYRFYTVYSSKYLVCTVPNDVTFLTMRIRNFTGVDTSVTLKNLMIYKKSMYDAGFTDYQPYAMSNAELTAAIQALQAQLTNQ